MRDQNVISAKRVLMQHDDVTSVGFGYRRKNGKRTSEKCLVVGVKKKVAAQELSMMRLIPTRIAQMQTDVQEKVFDAYSYTGKMRPCPPGYSIGHPLVTAGTLGAYVRRGQNEHDYFILSNNHVIAASNDGRIGDLIRQPGRADGGTTSDHFARLEEYAHIRFDGENGKKKKAAVWAWKAWSAPAHVLAWALRCPYRLRPMIPHRVEQPYPNLIDGAVARPLLETWVKLDYAGPEIGEIKGIRDLQLGDRVMKTGRTTEHTKGMVEVIGSAVKVRYGDKGTATFEDQLEIRADNGDFSAGGDSGSAIVSEDSYLGGLLFAGGSGVTIANRISHVVAILGVRF